MRLAKSALLLATCLLLSSTVLSAQSGEPGDRNLYRLRFSAKDHKMTLKGGLASAPVYVFMGSSMAPIPLPGGDLLAIQPLVLLRTAQLNDQGETILDFTWNGPNLLPFEFFMQCFTVDYLRQHIRSSIRINAYFDGSSGLTFKGGL